MDLSFFCAICILGIFDINYCVAVEFRGQSGVLCFSVCLNFIVARQFSHVFSFHLTIFFGLDFRNFLSRVWCFGLAFGLFCFFSVTVVNCGWCGCCTNSILFVSAAFFMLKWFIVNSLPLFSFWCWKSTNFDTVIYNRGTQFWGLLCNVHCETW